MQIGSHDFPFHCLKCPGGDLHGPAWDQLCWSAREQTVDALQVVSVVDGPPCDWVVVDHYKLDKIWETAARVSASRVLVIDDLANRSHDCDLLVDQTVSRAAVDYRGLVPVGCTVLAGAHYALLRPEFAAARSAALARRRSAGTAKALLLSLGTTDIDGLTGQVLDALLELDADCRIDVVIGAEASSYRAIEQQARRHGNIRVHVDTRDMARLMTEADLAIGAAGTSSWERCCLGLPTVMLAVAENQRLVARNLDRLGAAVTASEPAEAARIAAELMADPDRLAMMSAAAAGVTDGEGAARVASAMLGEGPNRQAEGLMIRPAANDDGERIWLWRNDPATRSMSQQSGPVPWRDHVRWLERVLHSRDHVLLIAETSEGPAGIIRFDRLSDGDAWEVSINLCPSGRGAGLGRAVLEAGCVFFLRSEGNVRLDALIAVSNLASKRIFEAVGFREGAPLGDTGFHRYVRREGAQ